MKFILMMQGTLGEMRSAGMRTWSPEAQHAHLAHFAKVNAELRAKGEWVGVQALAGPDTVRIVRADSGGAPQVTDGPFPESKELLAGYWLVDVADEARAYALAAKISTAPGADGKPMNMALEVRPAIEIPNWVTGADKAS